jgi:hypothetical protein
MDPEEKTKARQDAVRAIPATPVPSARASSSAVVAAPEDPATGASEKAPGSLSGAFRSNFTALYDRAANFGKRTMSTVNRVLGGGEAVDKGEAANSPSQHLLEETPAQPRGNKKSAGPRAAAARRQELEMQPPQHVGAGEEAASDKESEEEENVTPESEQNDAAAPFAAPAVLAAQKPDSKGPEIAAAPTNGPAVAQGVVVADRNVADAPHGLLVAHGAAAPEQERVSGPLWRGADVPVVANNAGTTDEFAACELSPQQLQAILAVGRKKKVTLSTEFMQEVGKVCVSNARSRPALPSAASIANSSPFSTPRGLVVPKGLATKDLFPAANSNQNLEVGLGRCVDFSLVELLSATRCFRGSNVFFSSK